MSDVEEAIRAGFLSEEKERVSAITQNLLDCGWIDTKDGELILHDWTDWRSYYTALQEKRAKRAEYMRSYRSGNGKDQEAEKPKEEKPEKFSDVLCIVDPFSWLCILLHNSLPPEADPLPRNHL